MALGMSSLTLSAFLSSPTIVIKLGKKTGQMFSLRPRACMAGVRRCQLLAFRRQLSCDLQGNEGHEGQGACPGGWWARTQLSVLQDGKPADWPQGAAGALGREVTFMKNLPALSHILPFTFTSD